MEEASTDQRDETEARFLETGIYSDAKVECGPMTWNVHKLIICVRSKWFEKAFQEHFKEGQSSVVIIHETDPAQLEWVLKYLYSRTFYAPTSPGFSENIYFAVTEAFKVADYFLLDDLKRHTVTHLKGELSNVVFEMQSLEKGSLGKDLLMAGKSAQDFYRDLFCGIQAAHISSEHMKPLLDVFVGFCHRARLAHSRNEYFEAGLRKAGWFAVELLLAAEAENKYYLFDSKQSCAGCKKSLMEHKRHVATPIRYITWRDAKCSDCIPL